MLRYIHPSKHVKTLLTLVLFGFPCFACCEWLGANWMSYDVVVAWCRTSSRMPARMPATLWRFSEATALPWWKNCGDATLTYLEISGIIRPSFQLHLNCFRMLHLSSVFYLSWFGHHVTPVTSWCSIPWHGFLYQQGPSILYPHAAQSRQAQS